MPDEHVKKTTRVSLTKHQQKQLGRWLRGAVVLIAGALLVAMVVAGRLETPPVAQPTPLPQATGDRLYLVNTLFNQTNQEPSSQLTVLEAQTHDLIYELPGVLAAQLSPDGTRLFVIDATSLRAIEAASGHEIWRTPLHHVAGQYGYGPTPLAITPDGRTIVVLCAEGEFPAPEVSPYWLQLINGATGELDPETIALPEDIYFTRIVPAQDSATVYLISPLKPGLLVSLIEKQYASGAPLNTGTGDAVLSADGKFLYVLEQADQQVSIAVLDTATWEQVRSVKLNSPDQRLEVSGGAFALLPGGDQVALGVNKVETSPFGPPGAISYNGSQMRIYATDTWQEISRLERDSPLTDFVFGASGLENTIYAGTEGAGTDGSRRPSVLIYHPDANQTFETHPLAQEMIVRNLLVGPAIPSDRPAITFEAPVATPAANLVPLTSTNQPAPPTLLGWLWDPDSGWNFEPDSTDLIAVSSGGEQTVVESRVQSLALPDGQPPLLIVADADQRSVLVDSVTGSRVLLDTAPQTQPYEPMLSPDGTQLAFKTRSDPFPADEYPVVTQLVICTTTTGACRRWLDWSDTPMLSSTEVAGWVNDRLYFFPTHNNNTPVWYLDLTSAHPAPTIILTHAMRFDNQNMGLNLAGDQLIYTADPPNPDPTSSYYSRSLLLHDLQTEVDSVLLEDVGWGPAVVAPDGRSLAHVRDYDLDGPELVVKDLLSGAESSLGRGLHSSYTQLRWSADSRWLLMIANDQGLQAQGAESLLIWDVRSKTLVHQIPIPRSWQLGRFVQPREGEQIYLSEERLTAIAGDSEYNYLITIDLRPGASRDIGYLKLADPRLHLVYVP